MALINPYLLVLTLEWLPINLGFNGWWALPQMITGKSK
jgi:hypothetical protein